VALRDQPTDCGRDSSHFPEDGLVRTTSVQLISDLVDVDATDIN